MQVQVSGHLADLLDLPSEIDQALADSFVGQEMDDGTIHIQNNDDGTRLLRVGYFGSSGHASRAHWGSANGGGIGHFAGD
jgi:hypothetical protein